MNLKAIKSLFSIAAVLGAPLVFGGDTDTIPSLTIDGVTYKNVELGTVSGSRVSIFYDGGGSRVAISNLPAYLQKRLNYDPELARRQDAAEAQRRAAGQQRLAQDARAIATAKATLGPVQKIHVVKVLNESRLQIVTTNGLISEAYVHNLPPEIIAFVRDLNKTQADVDATKDANALQTYTRSVGAGRRAGNVGTGILTDSAASIQQARRHLSELILKDQQGASTVIACPTAYLLSPTIRQWEFQGTPAPGLAPQ